ncbi:MAG: hypothetical protein ABFR75_01930 [Acidobacteriota bacterium]
MKTITFEIISLLKFKLDLVKYEKLSSKVKWVQKGINLIDDHFPGMLRYLSKQNIISNLSNFRIILECKKNTNKSSLIKVFHMWIRKEKLKRLLLVIIEGLIIPFTAVLALLPGPNFFFYVPALFFYYHFKSLQGLRKVEFDKLDIEVSYVDEFDQD